jgi:hypothetical protein
VLICIQPPMTASNFGYVQAFSSPVRGSEKVAGMQGESATELPQS